MSIQSKEWEIIKSKQCTAGDTKKELRNAVETLPKQLTTLQEDVKGMDGVGRRYTK